MAASTSSAGRSAANPSVRARGSSARSRSRTFSAAKRWNHVSVEPGLYRERRKHPLYPFARANARNRYNHQRNETAWLDSVRAITDSVCTQSVTAGICADSGRSLAIEDDAKLPAGSGAGIDGQAWGARLVACFLRVARLAYGSIERKC